MTPLTRACISWTEEKSTDAGPVPSHPSTSSVPGPANRTHSSNPSKHTSRARATPSTPPSSQPLLPLPGTGIAPLASNASACIVVPKEVHTGSIARSTRHAHVTSHAGATQSAGRSGGAGPRVAARVGVLDIAQCR